MTEVAARHVGAGPTSFEGSWERLAVTDDMLQGLEGLITLCREAVKRNIAVVHAWSL